MCRTSIAMHGHKDTCDFLNPPYDSWEHLDFSLAHSCINHTFFWIFPVGFFSWLITAGISFDKTYIQSVESDLRDHGLWLYLSSKQISNRAAPPKQDPILFDLIKQP